MKAWPALFRTILIASGFVARLAGEEAAAAPPAERTDVVPPKLLRTVPADYPANMLWSHLAGEVTLNFTVNPSGGIENISVAESNNPGFEDEAVDDLRRFRYRPAQRNGQPVAAATSYQMNFALPEASDGGDRRHQTPSYHEAAAGPSPANLPEAFRYDVAPKLRASIQPVYPYALLLSKDQGEATVAFTIGTDGRIHSTRVMQASRPEYGLALAAAVAQYRFDPALRKGKPVMTISTLHQAFNSGIFLTGITEGTTGDEMAFAQTMAKHSNQIVSSRSLDAPLHPYSRRPAVFPPDLTAVKGGKAIVRVIIDDTGHVRLPRVTAATDPAFGYAAVQAVQYWRFDPPKAHGKPVMTMVEIPFVFGS